MQAATMIDDMAKLRSFTDQLRRAIEMSGLSRRAICLKIGLDESVMSRFMNGRSGLALGTVDRIAALLELRITATTRRKGTR